VGETDLLVPTRNGKTPTRTAQLTVRCKALRLHPPRSRQRDKLPDAEVFVIHALETQPPGGRRADRMDVAEFGADTDLR
jgi:hypothetical protein